MENTRRFKRKVKDKRRKCSNKNDVIDCADEIPLLLTMDEDGAQLLPCDLPSTSGEKRFTKTSIEDEVLG
jgi:hypothetical protein